MNDHGIHFTQLAEMTSYDLHIGCWTCGVWHKYTEEAPGPCPHPLVGKGADGKLQRQAAEQEWELVLWLTEQGWSGDQEGHLECPSCTTKRLEEEGEDNHAEPPRRWTW